LLWFVRPGVPWSDLVETSPLICRGSVSCDKSEVQRESRLPGYWLSCTISCADAEQDQKRNTGKNYVLILTTDINEYGQIVASACDIYNGGRNPKQFSLGLCDQFLALAIARTSPRIYFAYDREHSIRGPKCSPLVYRHWRPFTEDSEQPLPIESQAESVLFGKFQ
jgi:hypothetical protein